MSIHFITGKPGGGKSLYAMKLLVEELVYGGRHIMTNLPVRLGELNAYLQEEYPNRNIDVLGRVTLLTDDEAAEFWTHRPGGVRIPRLTQDQWKGGGRPDYSAVQDSGVWYAIDEIHNYFNARAWTETGRDVLFYLSQHRKLGDTVLCITQSTMNVDKQFRSVAQDYTFLRNLKKERYGIFRMPGLFVRKTFTEPPGPNSQPMETGSFKLDVRGLARCYDTSVGVGIHNRGAADSQERVKGLNPVWYVVGLVALILVIVKGVPAAAAAVFRPVLPANHVPALPPAGPAGASVPSVVVEPPIRLASGAAREPVRTNLFLRGVTQFGGKVRVYLSDGRIVYAGDRELSFVGRDHVVYGGERITWESR